MECFNRMRVLAIAGWLLVGPFALKTLANENMSTEPLRFEANGLELSGILDVPAKEDAHALVIFVHGYGATNVVEQNWYYDLRSRFAAQGIASFVWDKPGCGDSEGNFDIDQPVASSANEVVAAAAFLRDRKAPGSDKIGLWGISRAGWIAPLALSRDEDLAFWISVSGVDDKESFGYLLESNWRIDGYDEGRIDHLLAEWRRGNEMVANGGEYADYLAATEDYRADEFVRYLSGTDEIPSETSFNAWRASVEALAPSFDPETGLMIYVDGFPQLLSKLDVPVLALFGEKDTSVDWRSTKTLYEETIGVNPNASLTVRTFPDANHNLHQSTTGGFREMLEILNAPEMAPGYYDVILRWLKETTM